MGWTFPVQPRIRGWAGLSVLVLGRSWDWMPFPPNLCPSAKPGYCKSHFKGGGSLPVLKVYPIWERGSFVRRVSPILCPLLRYVCLHGAGVHGTATEWGPGPQESGYGKEKVERARSRLLDLSPLG